MAREIRSTTDRGRPYSLGGPPFALSSQRPPQPDQPARDTEIQLWWRASDAQALYERAAADGVPILAEPFDGPFGRTFAMADPDGYRITVLRARSTAVLAAQGLTQASPSASVQGRSDVQIDHIRVPPSRHRFDLLDDIDPHACRVHDTWKSPLTPRLVGQGLGRRQTCLDQAGVLGCRVIDLECQERSIALVRPR